MTPVARVVLIVSTAFVAFSASRAQGLRREFEVASIKPTTVARVTAGAGLSRTPGGLTANSTISALVEAAYQTDLIDWTKVPKSLSSQRYEIRARANGRISGDQYWEMLQTLLENRFKLTFHRETKERQIYALVLAKPGKGLGSKLHASADADCPVNPNGRDFCGVRIGRGFMNGQRVHIARIARELAAFAGRHVQNDTGLTGSFDFELRWAADQSESKSGDVDKSKASDPSGPSFFMAVQEQLGLKLDSKRAPVEVIVIDHVERPEN